MVGCCGQDDIEPIVEGLDTGMFQIIRSSPELAARLARRRNGARPNTRRGLGCSHAEGSGCILAYHIIRSVAAWLP